MNEAALVADLGAVLQDMDSLGNVPATDSGVHSYAPVVIAKIRELLRHGGRHSNTRHFRSINRLLQGWHDLLMRHVDLVRERQLWHEESNVVVCTPWDSLASGATSSVATISAPYSGIRFMLCDILVPAELNPRGRLTQFNFAGIDFATPSVSTATVTYSTAAGVLGTPTVQGMDLTVFYQNKTAPTGRRGFRPWTGWIFDAAARIVTQIHNPDPAFARSYDLAWLMRSSPCAETYDRDMAYHRSYEGFDSIADMIHGAVIGLGQGGPVPARPRPPSVAYGPRGAGYAGRI